ncbi:unnamed protein product [Brassica napus]|uniref:(rape) hypothetical protein n=1 Tax=Brassica napus TaxID=3708 RepID=A0A816JHH3_BRANA|nr:unnamed protein product [Brassica napus]
MCWNKSCNFHWLVVFCFVLPWHEDVPSPLSIQNFDVSDLISPITSLHIMSSS